MSGTYSGEVGAYQHQTLSLHRWVRLLDETPSVYRWLHFTEIAEEWQLQAEFGFGEEEKRRWAVIQ
jgi:hypothetical protein